jgi:hypothetical protein
MNTNFIKKIDEKDKINILIFFKNISLYVLKNLKKGILVDDDDIAKIAIKELKNKKINLSNKTKENLEIFLGFLQKALEKQKKLIVDKNSKLYKNTLNQIIKKFKFDIKNLKNPTYLFNIINQILVLFNKINLNMNEKKTLIIDFFILNGISELEIKIIIIEYIIKELKNNIIFMKLLKKKKPSTKKPSAKKPSTKKPSAKK